MRELIDKIKTMYPNHADALIEYMTEGRNPSDIEDQHGVERDELMKMAMNIRSSDQKTAPPSPERPPLNPLPKKKYKPWEKLKSDPGARKEKEDRLVSKAEIRKRESEEWVKRQSKAKSHVSAYTDRKSTGRPPEDFVVRLPDGIPKGYNILPGQVIAGQPLQVVEEVGSWEKVTDTMVKNIGKPHVGENVFVEEKVGTPPPEGQYKPDGAEDMENEVKDRMVIRSIPFEKRKRTTRKSMVQVVVKYRWQRWKGMAYEYPERSTVLDIKRRDFNEDAIREALAEKENDVLPHNFILLHIELV